MRGMRTSKNNWESPDFWPTKHSEIFRTVNMDEKSLNKQEDVADFRRELESKARLQGIKEEELTRLLLAGDTKGLALAKLITQDTFDEAVRENMEEFGMSQQEAVEDAVKQFEAQGASLRNVNTEGKKKEAE